jgi:hypothetical protein
MSLSRDGSLADRAALAFTTRCQSFRNGQFSLTEPLWNPDRDGNMHEAMQ